VGKTKQNDIWKIKKEKGDAGYIINYSRQMTRDWFVREL